MSSTKLLWGQICAALGIVLVTMWTATQWIAWKLGFQPQLGPPWFELVGRIPIYYPPAFFWWWLLYDAYAPKIFMQGACIAASGGILSMVVAFESLTETEAEAFLEVVLRQHEPAYLEQLSRLLLAGKGPRQILDVLQIGAAQVLLETQDSLNFSISQHCYEYCNTLGWFYDSFEHPQRLKLLYSAASFLNRNAWHQKDIGDGRAYVAEVPAGAERMSELQLLERTLAAIVALDGPQAVAWAKAYLASSGDRQTLVQQLALTACRLGNDPHNQEIAQCLLEDYAKNRSFDRDRLLLACVQHTAVHRKYGDFLECGRRYGRAMGVAALA